MKNKFLLAILIFLSCGIYLNGQICGTKFSEKKIESLKSFYEKHDFSLSYRNKKIIPVTVWKGVQYILSLSDDQIFQLIDQANLHLASANIELFLWENKVRVVEDHSIRAYPNEWTYLSSGSFVERTLNIYFTGDIINNANGVMLGHDFESFNTDDYDAIFISGNKYSTSTLAHEVGHYLGLVHTFGLGGNAAGSTSVTNEKVDGSNCLQAGDFICDTPADPGNNIYGDCTYICSDISSSNCNREPGTNLLYTPDTKNIMSYFSSCRSMFSPQQMSIMNDYASTKRNFRIPTSDCSRDYYEPCFAYPFSSYCIGLGDSWIEEPLLTFKKSVTGKYDNRWDSDLYFMNLYGNNSFYKVSVVSDIQAILKIYQAGVPFSNTEYIISPGIINAITFNITGGKQRKSFDIRPLTSPDCGSSYTITIENFNGSCIDNNEPNNTKVSSTYLGELTNVGEKRNVSGLIEIANDVDFYSFKMNKPGKYNISLTNLNIDADFTYINDSGEEFKSHIKNGTSSESTLINKTSSQSTYGYIKVTAKDGLFNCNKQYNIEVLMTESNSNNECLPDSYEPNNSITQLTSQLAVGGTTEHTINLSGSIHISGDLDYYKLNMAVNGTANIYLQNLPKDYDLEIYSSNNSLLNFSRKSGMQDEFITFQNSTNSPTTIFILVKPYSNAFSCDLYKLQVHWKPNSNTPTPCNDNVYEPNSNVSQASTIFGNLGSQSKSITIHPIVGSFGDYDYFKITLTSQGALSLKLFSDHYPVRMQLSKDGYNFFLSKNSTSTNDPGNTPLIFNSVSTNEILYLRVYSPSNSFDCTKSLTINLAWSPVQNPPCNNSGFEPSETFEQADIMFFKFYNYSFIKEAVLPISGPNDIDFFKVITQGKGLLDINLESLPFDYDMYIYDANKILKYSSTYNNSTSEKISIVVESEDSSIYFIKIIAKNGEYHCDDTYVLNVNWQVQKFCSDLTNNSIQKAENLFELGNSEISRTVSNHKISKFNEKDYFRLSGSSSGFLKVNLSDAVLDYDLYLVDQSDKILSKSTQATSTEIIYFSKADQNQTIYIKIQAAGNFYDCNDNYKLEVLWIPGSNSIDGSGNDYPCSYVINPPIIDHQINNIEWSGNISQGQSKISNNYCENSLTGKELVFEYFYNPIDYVDPTGLGYSITSLSIHLTYFNNPNLNFYLLDGCDPSSSYCYGKGEIGFGNDYYASFSDLIPNKKYYIFVDGNTNDAEFTLGAFTTTYFTTSDPETGCGIKNPLLSFQCLGGFYDVVLDYSAYDVTSVQSDAHQISNLGQGIFGVHGVNSQEVQIQVKYNSSLGFECESDFKIPQYDCNVSLDNCFGIEAPYFPTQYYSCYGAEILQATVYNPNGFDVEWYENYEAYDPVGYGNKFKPKEFGTYFIKFKDPSRHCESDKVPVNFLQLPEIKFTDVIIHNNCNGQEAGSIELVFDKDPKEYEIYWSSGHESSKIENLPTGEYELTVFNSEQCKIQKSYKINEPEKLFFENEEAESNNIYLCQGEKAIINNSVNGGIPPYSIEYNGDIIPETIQLSKDGHYVFTAYDDNFCVIQRQINIHKSYEVPIDFILDTIENKIFLTCVALYENQGTWSTGETTPTIEINQSGEYAVEIIGEYNCVYSKTINVDILSSEIDIDKLAVMLFPNPANNSVYIKCNSCNDKEFELEIRSIDGLLWIKSPYRFNQELDISQLNPGVYTISLNIANLKVHKKLVVLR